jgi:TetR/AcrR family transcriptional repressor of nem operon
MSKAERTRQFIVETTAPIFNIKGYAGTSVSDLTAATGLTKGSIYGNFADKEAVAMAAFEHNWKLVLAVLNTEMGKHTSNRDKLLALASVFENYQSLAFPEGGCPLLNTAIEADDTHPGLRSKALAAFQGWKKHIVTLIEAGIAMKEFRKDVNAEQTAVGLIAMIEGAIMISKLTGNIGHRKAVMSIAEKTIRDLA